MTINFLPILNQFVESVIAKAPASVAKATSGYAGEGAATMAREIAPSSGQAIQRALTPLQDGDPFKIFKPASTALARTSSDLVPPPKLTATEIWAGVPPTQSIVLPSSQGIQGRVFLNAGDLNKVIEPPTIEVSSVTVPDVLPHMAVATRPVPTTSSIPARDFINPSGTDVPSPSPVVNNPSRQPARYSYVSDGKNLVSSSTTPTATTASATSAVPSPSPVVNNPSRQPAPTPPPAINPVVDPQPKTWGDRLTNWSQTPAANTAAIVGGTGLSAVGGGAIGWSLAQIPPSDPLA
jgi:hypothetical protein